MSDPILDEAPPRREPIFNAPWPAMTLTLLLIASFVIQLQLPERVWADYVLTPAVVM